MMVNQIGISATVHAMKNNVIFQLMVNKFFDGKTGELDCIAFPDMGEFGQGITNHLFYCQHMALTGKLPPAFIVTAKIAEGVSANRSDERKKSEAEHDIHRTMRYLKFKRSSCGVCGATRSTDGKSLSLCAKCRSVAYCCSEHQRFHWKRGGHKQQCNYVGKMM